MQQSTDFVGGKHECDLVCLRHVIDKDFNLCTSRCHVYRSEGKRGNTNEPENTFRRRYCEPAQVLAWKQVLRSWCIPTRNDRWLIGAHPNEYTFGVRNSHSLDLKTRYSTRVSDNPQETVGQDSSDFQEWRAPGRRFVRHLVTPKVVIYRSSEYTLYPISQEGRLSTEVEID